jgi:hypothetical protein
MDCTCSERLRVEVASSLTMRTLDTALPTRWNAGRAVRKIMHHPESVEMDCRSCSSGRLCVVVALRKMDVQCGRLCTTQNRWRWTADHAALGDCAWWSHCATDCRQHLEACAPTCVLACALHACWLAHWLAEHSLAHRLARARKAVAATALAPAVRARKGTHARGGQ